MPYVDSSMIEELEYVPETATLIVTFRSDGGIWGYLGVPPEIYAALLVAPDVDMTFNALVKDSFPRRATLAPRHGERGTREEDAPALSHQFFQNDKSPEGGAISPGWDAGALRFPRMMARKARK